MRRVSDLTLRVQTSESDKNPSSSPTPLASLASWVLHSPKPQVRLLPQQAARTNLQQPRNTMVCRSSSAWSVSSPTNNLKRLRKNGAP